MHTYQLARQSDCAQVLKLSVVLRACCLAVDSGHYTITWTIKNGGWPRYIATNIAGMYKLVFGITDVKGLEQNDFKFIPAASVKPIKVQDDAADVDDTAAAADDQTRIRWAGKKAGTQHIKATPLTDLLGWHLGL